MTTAASPPTLSIAALSQWLRDIYVLECRRRNSGSPDYGSKRIPQWDGGTDKWGKVHQSIWPKLAKFIMLHHFDPLTFIQAQFNEATGGRAPLPNALMSATAVAKHKRYTTNVVDDLRRALVRQFKVFQGRLFELEALPQYTEDQRLLLGIYDESSIEATPLFRYCFANQSGLHDVMNYYHTAALSQYVFQQPVYDAAWGKIIPHGLRQEATTLRSQLGY